jgi:hypothetical protein
VAADEGHVLEDPRPEGDECYQVEVEPQSIPDEREQDGHQGVRDEAADEDAIVVDAIELRTSRAEDGVEGRDDGHGHVPRDLETDVDLEDETQQDAQGEACQG